jgi:hypothetical protein
MIVFETDFEKSDSDLIQQVVRDSNIQFSDNDDNVYVLNNYNAGIDVFNIGELGRLIAESWNDAYEIVRDNTGKFIEAIPTEIAKKLVELKHARADYHRTVCCHDYVYQVLEALWRRGIYSFDKLNADKAESNEVHACAINDLIVEIRKKLQSYKVQERMANKRKNAKKNYVSALQLTNALFTRYSRLCVIRVDFGYKRYADGSMVTQTDAALDMKSFLAWTKKHVLFEHCVGYVGKIEFGMEKGYHFHNFFYFDGANVIDDVYYADQIGKFWVNEITSGQGIYENCNKRKYQRYPGKCGIGMVHHADTETRSYLEYAIGYVCKAAQYLMAKPTGRTRLFYRSQLPKGQKSKAGRPRRLMTEARDEHLQKAS